MPLGPNFGGIVESGNGGGGGSKKQIFPARVKNIILQPSTDPNSLFVKNNGYTSFGFITFHPLYSTVDTDNPANLIAAPIDANIQRVPLVNEVVLIVSAPDILNDNPMQQKYYYISNVNIWNSVHHNGFPDLQNLTATQKSEMLVGFVSARNGIVKKQDDTPKDLFLGNTFIEDPDIRNLIPVEGDILFEGRYGQSIRFSHTANAPSQSLKNPWSVSGSSTPQPITIIRNGQTQRVPSVRWTPIFEDIDGDASSIYLTNGQEIQMNLASNNLASYGLSLKPSDSVVQIPNYTIQPTDKSVMTSDDEELTDAKQQKGGDLPLPQIAAPTASIPNAVQTNSTISTPPPTASVSPTVEKAPTKGPGSSKETAIPESQLGQLSWSGEEVANLNYQQNYAEIEEDESQYWSKNPQSAAISKELEKTVASLPPTAQATPADLQKAIDAAASGLDTVPGVFQNNAKQNITLAVVGDQCIEVSAAKAFYAMTAAAAKDGVKITVSSGFRPPFQSIKAKSSKGVNLSFTAQADLRTADRWRGPGPFNDDAKFNAGASKYFPATAAPGKSQHGNGVAIDINTGGFPTKNPSASVLTDVFSWMAINGWKFGFVRTVSTEAWHWEYHPGANGPYYKFSGQPDAIYKSISKAVPFGNYKGKTVNFGQLWNANNFGLNA